MEIIQREVDTLIPYVNNTRTHSQEQVQQIASSIKEFGFTNPILLDEKNGVIAGHGRIMAAHLLDIKQVPTITLTGLSDAQIKAYIIADNKLALNAGWDEELLKVEIENLQDMNFDIDLLGFDKTELDELFGDIDNIDVDLLSDRKTGKGSLSEKFGIPPFSILNAREGWWQNRKKIWINQGIKSEEGRSAGLYSSIDVLSQKAFKKDTPVASEESIFDPVLAELCYRWWCPTDGTILDPFAGGSVRGVVASKVGRQYIGGELRKEQVDANIKQANEIIAENEKIPVWINADSMIIDETCSDVEADFVFSCPPYADLEVYSDDPKDISNMGYDDFKEAYFEIIKKTCSLLKEDRFACFVVGEIRDKKGNYYDFVGDTVQAFKEAGLEYYNEAILVTPTGSLALRAGRYFEASRKLGKAHQNVLVFLKGDAKEATKACGICEFGEVEEDTLIDD